MARAIDAIRNKEMGWPKTTKTFNAPEAEKLMSRQE
jgi:hypothetical protein